MKTLDASLGIASEEEKWKELLKKFKVFKDMVKKKDIWLTRTEVCIIDTPEFQRLRRIFQLGPANLLFMGANHTRLEHSIGALYKSQCIIDAINTNYEDFGVGRKLKYREVFVIRLTALIHDAVFITYSHILEDEGRIFRRQWEDEKRIRQLLLNKNSRIREALESNVVAKFGKQRGEKITDEIMSLIVKILRAKTERDIISLGEYAFVADIIQNTICADLLDYLERDVYCTGIFGEYDTRMVSYFIVEEYKNQPRLVIKLYKRKTDDFRWDVINNGILACLRLRRNLSSSIYFHHTRSEASAMIIKMTSAALKAGVLDAETIYKLDDFSLPSYIWNSSQEKLLKNENLSHEQKRNLETARLLAESFQNRVLYKPVLKLSREDYRQKQTTMTRLKELTNWEIRYDFETTVEETADVEPGSVILYIPDKLKEKEPEMFLKEARTLVRTKYGIETLEKLGARDEFKLTIGAEIDNLASSHKALFRVSLFVYPRLEKKDKELTKAICEQWLKDSVPVSIVDALTRREKVDTKERSLTEIAADLYEDFGEVAVAKPANISRLSHFVEFAKHRLQRTM